MSATNHACLQSRAKLGLRSRSASGSNSTFVQPAAASSVRDSDVHIPSSPLDFPAWLLSFLGVLKGSRNGLNGFIASSFRPSACTAQPLSRGGDLWPCPPPKRWIGWTGSCNLSPRRRSQHRAFKAAHELLRHAVATLNWLALGSPKVCPPHACAGAPLSSAQNEMLCGLERLFRHFVSADPISASSLGRCESKFVSLLHTVQQLPSDTEVGVLLHELSAQWLPYERNRPKPPAPSPEPMTKPCTVKLPAGNLCLPVVAERIKWKLSPSFDPTPFLSDPVVRSVFLRPDTLRVAPGSRPELPASQVRCTRSELLALASKWGRCNAF